MRPRGGAATCSPGSSRIWGSTSSRESSPSASPTREGTAANGPQAIAQANVSWHTVGAFIRAGLRLLGGNPGTLIRLAQRGYQQLFRDAGALVVGPLREDAVRVVGVDLPAILIEETIYLEDIGESIAVLPHLVRHEGFSEMHVSGDEVTWTITWRPVPG